MSSFALTVKRSGHGAPVLTVRGDLDLYTAREFEERLQSLTSTEPGGVIVDLAQSTFLDSSACRALLHAARVLRKRAAKLVVVNRDPEVARILQVMGLDEFLEIVPDVRDARSLASPV